MLGACGRSRLEELTHKGRRLRLSGTRCGRPAALRPRQEPRRGRRPEIEDATLAHRPGDWEAPVEPVPEAGQERERHVVVVYQHRADIGPAGDRVQLIEGEVAGE